MNIGSVRSKSSVYTFTDLSTPCILKFVVYKTRLTWLENPLKQNLFFEVSILKNNKVDTNGPNRTLSG